MVLNGIYRVVNSRTSFTEISNEWSEILIFLRIFYYDNYILKSRIGHRALFSLSNDFGQVNEDLLQVILLRRNMLHIKLIIAKVKIWKLFRLISSRHILFFKSWLLIHASTKVIRRKFHLIFIRLNKPNLKIISNYRYKAIESMKDEIYTREACNEGCELQYIHASFWQINRKHIG